MGYSASIPKGERKRFRSEDGSLWEVVAWELARDVYTCVKVRALPFLPRPVRVFGGAYICWREKAPRLH